MSALQRAQSGATLYRAGTLGVQNTTDAQFWSFENPLNNSNYANQMGMPEIGTPTFDWVMAGKLAPRANLVTRPAPALGVNAGGNVEAVVNPGSVNIQWFYMPSR